MAERRVSEAKACANTLLRSLTRSSFTEGLPERVALLVRAKDRESEQLLCVVQLALAATLAGLYAVAPRPSDAGMGLVEPVPLALAAYFALTLLRMWYVRRAPLSGWAVSLSILADMALLFGLIWSFHWDYRQPAAFSLKAPTFLYAFVFVAIRSLRFDFRAVLTAGLVAAAGWLLMTLAALNASPAGTVTRSFSEYLLSNRILIGAEFDKIFALVSVAVVLSIAAYRAERTLVAAVRVETANREIGKFLSRGVAVSIANADEEVRPGTVSSREAAIIFLDIRGFTRFSMSVPPEAVVMALTSFHARIVPIVRAHNGVIDKFLGDGVMITFGAVEPSDRAVADALRALEALIEASRSWERALTGTGISAPLVANAALASGRIVFAALGDSNRLEYTVIGEAVNLAAKLEKHNKAEGSRAVASYVALERAREQGYAPHPLPEIRTGRAVAGVSGTIDLAVWTDAGVP